MSRDEARGALALLTIVTAVLVVLTFLMVVGVIDGDNTQWPAQDPPAFNFTTTP